MTPVARTLLLLKDRGWTPQVVETRITARLKRDPFGLDVIAVRPFRTLGIQVTDVDHYAEHRKDIEGNPLCKAWVEGGNELQCWAWHVRGKRRKEPLVWDLLLPTWLEDADA